MKIKIIGSIVGLFSFIACHPSKKLAVQPVPPAPLVVETAPQPSASHIRTDAFMEDLLKANPQYFGDALTHRKDWKVQIIYTQIDRQANNNPLFKSYAFNIDSTDYFYPASTVKMPVALLALQRLNELKTAGLDKNTSLITEAAYSKQTAVYNDPDSRDGRPTIANYVKKIFLVSDNDAFNRLYEFLGQQYINDRLHAMGYEDAQIVHHLEVFMTDDENRHTNPVKFLSPAGKVIYEQPLQFNRIQYSPRNDSMGTGYYSGGRLINHPMNFSKKNRISLDDLTNILKSVLFPQSVPAAQRFNLTPEDYKFVWQYMSQFPSETSFPQYDSAAGYQDAYVKLLLYGTKKGALPKQIRIFNKEGDAYGCLTDVAYVVDFENKIEFMLSARIYCNSDGILNDSKYDYDTIGLPFMKHLGEVIYQYELQRPRAYKPDLSSFMIQYDK